MNLTDMLMMITRSLHHEPGMTADTKRQHQHQDNSGLWLAVCIRCSQGADCHRFEVQLPLLLRCYTLRCYQATWICNCPCSSAAPRVQTATWMCSCPCSYYQATWMCNCHTKVPADSGDPVEAADCIDQQALIPSISGVQGCQEC